MKKQLLLIGSIALLCILFYFLFYEKDEFLKDPVVESDVNHLPKQEVFASEVDNLVTNQEIMQNFVADRLIDSGVIIEIELGEPTSDEITKSELRDELFSMFSTSLLKQDLDLFTAVISEESIKELWGKEEDIDKNLKKLIDTLQILSKNGSFQKLSYKLDKVQKKSDRTVGDMTLYYSEDTTIIIPFQAELLEGQHLPYYQFKTTVTEMLSIIENQ